MTDPYNEAVTSVLPPDDNLRIGRVIQAAPLIVDVQGGSVQSPGVISGAAFAFGDVVALLRQDQSWLVLGTVATSNLATITGQVSFSDVPGADSTTGAAYSNFGVGTGTTFTKRIAGTKLRIDFSASCFSTTTNTGVRFGMDVFNNDDSYQFTMCQMLINTALEHNMVVGGGLFDFVAPGTYTVQPLWLRYSGAGTLTSGATDDWITYIVSEVN